MKIENLSPFPHMVYEKATTKARHFDVIVLAGTFELVHGQPVLPVAEQLPINIADRYVGDPESSAFIEETHLSVAKKNTDIHLIGHAKSPRNEPSKGWPVGVGVGPVRKLAQVSCPRSWEWWPLRGWHLGQHQPTTQVELHSGMAYGGAFRRAKMTALWASMASKSPSVPLPMWLWAPKTFTSIKCQPLMALLPESRLFLKLGK